MAADSPPNSAPPRLSGPARLCSLFVTALNVSGASISVFGSDGNQSTICSTNIIAARGDSLQFTLGEGPRWDVRRYGIAVLCADLESDGWKRWPAFAAGAIEAGIAAVYAFPMTMGAASVGVVDLYSDVTRRLDPQQIALAASMASRAAAPAASEATRSANAATSTEQVLAPAIRREVHQATGMVQVQLDITTTEAFIRLQAHAFGSGRTLDDIARDVINRQLDFRTIPD